ncbi:MAG: GGDEF domain-containing protein [Marinobacter psychrophilus]|jgi:GGDEF domain-containing protein
MLLTNTSKENAENVVSKLCQSLEKYNQETKRGYDIVFSHGIVEFAATETQISQSMTQTPCDI